MRKGNPECLANGRFEFGHEDAVVAVQEQVARMPVDICT